MKKIGVYIHIPFCANICSYCDFSKIYYKENIVDSYLNILEKEIRENYKNEEIYSIYIGGGTPSSLNIKQLNKLFDIIKIFKYKNIEFTFECNSEDLTDQKLLLLKNNNVNRLSIGVQTFNEKILKKLNRKVDYKNIIKATKIFNNINIDLMYGFNNQNLEMVKNDIDNILRLNIKHISYYTLIIEPNTKLYIDKYMPLDDDDENEIYNFINKYLHNFNRYETSNYALEGFESKHNLLYWDNEYYYGFGLGSHGYIDNVRYENTRSINKYLNNDILLNSHELTKKENIENELILGFRKTKGININDFKNKFKINITDIEEIKEELSKNNLIIEKNNIFINPKYAYISNEILLNFINIEKNLE